jgi:hypothetical protein
MFDGEEAHLGFVKRLVSAVWGRAMGAEEERKWRKRIAFEKQSEDLVRSLVEGKAEAVSKLMGEASQEAYGTPVYAVIGGGTRTVTPLQAALLLERPDYAGLMLREAGCGATPEDLMVAARLRERGGKPERPPPEEREGERLEVFRKLIERQERALNSEHEGREYVHLCTRLIREGEGRQGYLEALIGTWERPLAGIDNKNSKRGRPYREYAEEIGQRAQVDWLGVRGCRVAWVRAVARAQRAVKGEEAEGSAGVGTALSANQPRKLGRQGPAEIDSGITGRPRREAPEAMK